MQFDLRTVTLAPSGFTYGVIAVAAVLTAVVGIALGRSIHTRWRSGGWHTAVALLAVAIGAAALPLVMLLGYMFMVAIIVPGACTYFVRPHGLALAVPVLALLISTAWRETWFRRYRSWAVAAAVIVVWLSSLEATYTLAEGAAYLEASERYAVRGRQEINREAARAIPPGPEHSLAKPFDGAGWGKLRQQTRDEVRALLGEPSDEGADPGSVRSRRFFFWVRTSMASGLNPGATMHSTKSFDSASAVA